jgi:hypothetical protein
MDLGECQKTGQRRDAANNAGLSRANPSQPGPRLPDTPDTWPRPSWLRLGGQVIDCVAALGAGLVGSNLPDALEDLDLDALLGKSRQERADGVRCLARCLSDLRSAGTLDTAQSGRHAQPWRMKASSSRRY